MVRLLEEGFDRLKISVDVINVDPEELDYQEQPVDRWCEAIAMENTTSVPQSDNGITPVAPVNAALLFDDNPENANLTAPVNPSQAATAHGPDTEPANHPSFQKLDEIIRELTKKVKGRTNPEDLISLTLLSDYNILREHLHVSRDPTPDKTASLRIASCKRSQKKDHLTKGPWFARRLRELGNHVLKYRQLPERKQGKGGKHSSLLNEKEVYTAIGKFMNQCETGAVCLNPDITLHFCWLNLL